MAVKLTTTRVSDPDNLKVKVCVFGPAGVGKTALCGTAPRPLIISAESGLLSLAGKDIPVAKVESKEDVDEVFSLLHQQDWIDRFDTICLDSITEIAETHLSNLKKIYTDGRQFYGILADDISEMIRKFRDLEHYNVVFTAKQERVTDDYTGITTYKGGMPGNNLTNGLPYFFDELFAMRIGTDDSGANFRYIQPQPDISYEAKDRSGALGNKTNVERPDLTFLFNKIRKHLLDGAPMPATGALPEEKPTETES